MSTKVKTELGYQVPSMFVEREVRLQYLKDAGIKNPRLSDGKLLYFLNTLRVTSHIHRSRYGDTNGWVPLKKEISRRLYGNMTYFYAIVDKLESDGLIERHPSYRVGKRSKRYRLKPIIDTDEWKVVKVKASECTTTKKVLEFIRKGWRPIDHELYNRLTRFDIDIIPFFEQTTVHNFHDYPCPLRDAIMEGFAPDETPQYRYGCWKDYYNDIRAGEWRYKVDDYGRRHNNITNLPKELRKCLYLFKGGEERRLNSVDIKNSQVLLLLTILPPTLESYNIFKEIVESGWFYETLAVLCCRSRPNGKYKDCTSIDKVSKELRALVKDEYFQYAYGNDQLDYIMISDVYQAMYDHFHDIHSYISAFKGWNGYEFLSRQMQRMESSIIIDHVCYKAIEAGLKFAQIYDSILCLEEDVPAIEQFLKEGFNSKGLNVTLKVE